MTQKKTTSAPKKNGSIGKPTSKGRNRGPEMERASERSRAGSGDEATVGGVVAARPPGKNEGLEGAMRALELALDKKALEPVLLDVRDLCSFCNYQLVISGRSDRQVDAIADGISAGLKMDGMRPIGAEGARSGQWSLLDYGDFVVHVFLHAAREHYDLEGLWNDAARVPIEVPEEARLPPDEPYDAVGPYGEASR